MPHTPADLRTLGGQHCDARACGRRTVRWWAGTRLGLCLPHLIVVGQVDRDGAIAPGWWPHPTLPDAPLRPSRAA